MRARAPSWLAGPGRTSAVLAALAFSSCTGAAAGRHAIEIEQLEYRPGQIEIALGDTVVWFNHDIVPHTVTLSANEKRSDTVASGDSMTIVVQQPGARHYHCRFHPTMTGVLQVR